MKESKVTVRREERGFLDILCDLFCSVKLTIFLLILLAILSIIGTLIKQNAPSSEYIQRYGIGLYEVLNFFDLFDMYHSSWFSAVLLLLVINLITCSIQRLSGVWNQVFRNSGCEALEDSILRSLPYVEKIRISDPVAAKGEGDIRPLLQRWFRNLKRTETELTIVLFSEKGRFSRLGVPIVHLSILIILAGGLMGSIFGFKGIVNILEGETVDKFYLRVKAEEVQKPIGFSVRCDDFKVTYYDFQRSEKLVKEYTSILTIIENGKEILKKSVEVNHPLYYKGLAFYQSSYGTIYDVTLGVQRKNHKEKLLLKMMEGEIAAVPGSDIQIQLMRYVSQIHNFGEGIQIILLRPNQDPIALWVLKKFPQVGPKNDFIITFEEVASKEYTGLQVAKDPGVRVVWVGSGLLIFGLIVSFFFSHQRVWIRIPKSPGQDIVLAGSTNKNRVGFEEVFNQLAEGIRSKS